MKKEDLQNLEQGTDGAENKGESREEQKNTTLQAGLGRDRMKDIENSGGMAGKDDYADDNNKSRQNTGESTER